MKIHTHIVKGITLIALFLGAAVAHAQSVNNWRGDETGSDWTDPYKWKLKHVPEGDETVHFREAHSVIQINSTIQLNNGMHLYGEELSLQGNGNINLWSPVSHQRTVNIPASATGFATMTLSDNLSLNGRIALSSKGFGTSASKGSVTLKDRSCVTGALSIGNAGTGTGQVFVKGNATYRITELDLATKSDAGGSAEIHILGGTVRIETKQNPFDTFLEDSSRKIILGDSGTLRIENNLPVYRKKDSVKEMILQDRLVAAPGCRLTPPVIQDKMIIIRAEDERNQSTIKSREDLIAAIDRIPNRSISTAVASNNAQPKKLESLLNNMRSSLTETTTEIAKANTAVPQAEKAAEMKQNKGSSKMAGYIVVFGSALLVLRRPHENQEEE
ncbi:MAG: hypothetical protein V3V05_05025 [Pontiella sp.]